MNYLTEEEKQQLLFDWRYKGFSTIELLSEEECDELNEEWGKLQLEHSTWAINDRIENVKFDEVVYLSARALRNLNSLLFIVENNVSRETVCVFPKGRSYKKELVESHKNWKFDLNLIDSITSEDSKVIVLRGLERVN